MYSISNKCDFSHHDVDIRWWTIHAFMVFNEESNESKINAIRQSLELICELQQQQQYPIVKDSSEFCGIDYKYGKNSNKRFRSMNIDTAIQVFSFLKSKFLNYEDNDIATGLIGITKTNIWAMIAVTIQCWPTWTTTTHQKTTTCHQVHVYKYNLAVHNSYLYQPN
jgi:hypothetical protein